MMCGWQGVGPKAPKVGVAGSGWGGGGGSVGRWRRPGPSYEGEGLTKARPVCITARAAVVVRAFV